MSISHFLRHHLLPLLRMLSRLGLAVSILVLAIYFLYAFGFGLSLDSAHANALIEPMAAAAAPLIVIPMSVYVLGRLTMSMVCTWLDDHAPSV